MQELGSGGRAAGAVVHLLLWLVRFEARAADHSLTLRPTLPTAWNSVRVRNLHVGPTTVDFTVTSGNDRPTIDVERVEHDLNVSLR